MILYRHNFFCFSRDYRYFRTLSYMIFVVLYNMYEVPYIQRRAVAYESGVKLVRTSLTRAIYTYHTYHCGKMNAH